MTRYMLALCLCLTLSGWALPPVHPDRGEAAFQRAVLRASNDLRLLCFAAHPDDEDGATLAYYGLSRGVHTFTALANYGEGGQNEIGGQLYGDLAVLRARETRAAAELLGTQEVVCMNLEDFGYSKTLAETLEKWGRERTLEQMIVVIRSLRPDVIITNHQPGQGHGHHQAIAALLLPAVEGAANRQEYPEMKTRGLAAWKVSRVFVRRNLPWSTGQEDYDVKVPVGTWDALRGATYLEIAAAALKEHKSQGRWEMVDDVLPSATYTYFTQIYPPGEQVTNDLFEGLTEGFAPARGHYPLYDASAAITLEAFAPCNAPLSRAAAAMPRSREETGRLLAEAHNFLSGLPALSGLVPLERAQPSEETRLLERAVTRYLHERREDVSAALWECAGLSAMLESDDAALVRRQPFTTRLTVTALGPATLTDVTAAMLLPFQWPSQGLVAGVPEPLAPGESARFSFSNQVFSEAPVSTPLEELRRDLFPPRSPLKATVTARAYGALFSRVVETPARVVPELEIRFDRPALTWVRPATGDPARPVEFFVEVRNNTEVPCDGRLSLFFPTTVSRMAHELFPASREYALQPGRSAVWRVRGDITSETPTGRFSVFVLAEGSARHSAAADLPITILDATLPAGLSVGVFTSYDDTLAEALENLGAAVVELDGARMPFVDLSGFDSVFVDLRAYLVHPQLAQYNSLLLDYARAGGNLVVMYQKTEEWKSELAPYPLVLGRERVTLEDAPVTLLEPTHPLLSWPNVLDAGAWQGWVQERGLYFPREVDSRYTRLVSMADAGGEPLSTGWLVADAGKGSYIYTSLVWYRQLRERRPGAYQALANMAAYPRRPR